MKTDGAPQVPILSLNQLNVCPRLFYQEFVGSLMISRQPGETESPHVAGTATTRRHRAIHTRTMTLASHRLGLIGTLNLLDRPDGDVCPVLYRGGEAPIEIESQGARPVADALQLCAQGLLIEYELDLCSHGGLLYYRASETRIEIEFTESLRAQTLELVRRARTIASLDTPPGPLESGKWEQCRDCILATTCRSAEELEAIRQEDQGSRLIQCNFMSRRETT